MPRAMREPSRRGHREIHLSRAVASRWTAVPTFTRLGVTLYELATAELPVRGSENPAALPSGIGPIISKLMADNAAVRYRTAAEARQTL